MMKRLTIEEELAVLKLLDENNAEYVASGAARFLATPIQGSELDKLLTKMGLDYSEKPFVIKVPMGPGGLAQTMAEINTYCEYDDIRYCLADIYGYGLYLEFMEQVDADFYDYNYFRRNGLDTDPDTFADEIAENGDSEYLIKSIQEHWDLSADEIRKLLISGCYAFWDLIEIFGHTSDVGQIGTDLNHTRPKAYDYGFFYDLSCSEQTSDMDGDDYEGIFGCYIPELVNCLEYQLQENGNLFSEYDARRAISSAESNFCDEYGYDNEDYDPYDHDEEYYQVGEEEDPNFNHCFDSRSSAIAFAKDLPMEKKPYVEYVVYAADYDGNSLNDREYETIWDYTEMEDTRYWEEDDHDSEDMKDTSFWEKQDE